MAKSTSIVERVKVFNPILNCKSSFSYDRLGCVYRIVCSDLLFTTIINSIHNTSCTNILILSNDKEILGWPRIETGGGRLWVR